MIIGFASWKTGIPMLLAAIVLLFSANAACAQAGDDPSQTRAAQILMTGKPAFSISGGEWSVSAFHGGGILLRNGVEDYAVESCFSYPNMPGEEWNKLAITDTPSGDWRVSVKKTKSGIRITGRGRYYELSRMVTLKADRVTVDDTFTNLSGEPVGIAFDNKVTPLGALKEINLAGPYGKTFRPYTAGDPAWNPTIYFAGENGGLGMVAVDDYYRLQLNLKREGNTGCFENRSFGLPAGDSYTFSWALYPTRTSDYYEFINKARRDYVPNHTLEGGVAFLNHMLPLTWPKEQMSDWLKHRGVKIAILIGPHSGGPWLGEDSNYIYKVPNFNLDEYLLTLKKARSVLKDIDPEIKCLAPFETALSPDHKAGDLTPAFPDSVAICPDGSPAGYYIPPYTDPEERRKFRETNPHQFIYYPTATNSYYKWIRERILRGLEDAQMDGIYFDLFSYAYGFPPDFRWTYDRWDNRTVDLDTDTWTIAAKKADLCKLTEDTRAEIVKMILGYKKGNVVVANDMGVAGKIRALPIFHFLETIEDYGYVMSHFSTPIPFGFYGGYARDAEYIGKEGTWWKTWNSDSDYFQDVKDKLNSGCLYYTYAAPGGYEDSKLTRPTILTHMFPVTIEELHVGWIKGRERIITLHPGEYTWGDRSSARAYFYDADGKECLGELKVVRNESGANAFRLSFPEGGAAVIIRNRKD